MAKLNEVKKKSKKKQRGKKNDKMKVIIICSIAVILTVVVALVVFAVLNRQKETIYNNVYVQNISLSGLDKDAATKLLTETLEKKGEDEISFKLQEYETKEKYETFKPEFNIEEVVNTAYNVGRTDNIFSDTFKVLSLAMNERVDIPLKATIKDEELKAYVHELSKNIKSPVVNYGYDIDEDKSGKKELIITAGKAGDEIIYDELKEKIEQEISTFSIETIDVPIEHKEAEEIDIDKIHKEVYKEPKDATSGKDSQGRWTIVPHEVGIDFDVAKAKELLKTKKSEYKITLTTTLPKVTNSMMGDDEFFPNRLSTFSTRYDATNTNRSTNLSLAGKKINGTVLLPGETFSYNKVVGKRTVEDGYKEAHVFSGGQVVDGIGGGICQISSTLYNAALLCNMEIVERRNHAFQAGYVQPGRDATVVYGVTDFKFKNTRDTPVKIKCTVKNGTATISIYGTSDPSDYEVSIESVIISSTPYSTRYVEMDNEKPGKVVQTGWNGVKSEAYRILKKNGAVVKKELLSKDTYKVLDKIVAKAKTVDTAAPPAEENPSDSQDTEE